MNKGGTKVENGEDDPSDWRTAPDFSGLVKVATPAFPNPVSYNAEFEIQLNIVGIDAINGLYLYAVQQPSVLSTAPPLRNIQGTIQPGLKTFRLSPQEFARSSSTGSFGKIYRIIIVDNQRTVITYGDVLVK